MKVLFYTNLFPNNMQPERGVFCYQLAKELKKKCSLTVVSPLPWFPHNKILNTDQNKWSVYSKIDFKQKFKGFEVYYPKYFHLPLIGDYFSYLSLFYSLKSNRLYADIKTDVDIINAHWAYPDGVAAMILADKLNLPCIISVRGSDINRDLEKKYFRRLILRSFKRCKRIISVSSALREVMIEHGVEEHKIRVINNGIDLDRFKPVEKVLSRKELGLSEDKKIILFAGRLEAVKNLDLLIQVCSDIKASLFNTKVIIIGDGSLRSELIEQVKELGLESTIEFVGNKSHEEIAKWFGASDLLCLPSKSEGHPNVVMEALASGRPVVASNVGDIPKFVSKKTGLIFKAGDEKDFAEKLTQSLDKDWDQDEIRASVDSMSWEQSATQYINEYRSVYHEKK